MYEFELFFHMFFCACSFVNVEYRISTFYSLVDLGRQYSLYMTGTNPMHTRLALLGANPAQAVVIAMYYSVAQRLQVRADIGCVMLCANRCLNIV